MRLDSIDVVSGDYGLTLPLNYPQAELRAIWAHRILEAGVLEVVWGEPMWRHLVVGIDHRKLLPMTGAERILRREDELEELAREHGMIDVHREAMRIVKRMVKTDDDRVGPVCRAGPDGEIEIPVHPTPKFRSRRKGD